MAITGAVLPSCKTVQPAVDTKDISYLYNPTKNPVNPKYDVTNVSDDQSVLSVEFKGSELFFSEANPEGRPTAVMILTVKLYDISRGRILADTAFYNFNIIKEEGRTDYIYTIPLRVKTGLQYIAEVKILDRIRAMVIQAFVPFNTLTITNRYNFLVQDHFFKRMLFNPVLKRDEFVNLVYLRGHPDSIYISYYKPFRLNPDPPSMILPERTIDYGPDTTISLAYSDTLPMMFPKNGIYMCSIERDINEGYTFFNFGRAFPEMNDPVTMIEPLTYLTSEEQLDSLMEAPKPKLALDEFWIKCGGNVERARELIRIYYTRVVYANHYFTSYKEGWRTERGMIYIIYGPPDKIYADANSEKWGYRKPVLKSEWGTRYKVKEEYLYFTFKKKPDTFSDNDYYLSRSESLVTYWAQAVQSWKEGIVFRLDNPKEF